MERKVVMDLGPVVVILGAFVVVGPSRPQRTR